jgi:hypothetical protein
MYNIKCSFCKNFLRTNLINFKKIPIANQYKKGSNPKFFKYRLEIKVCDKCFLVQSTNKIQPKKIFKHYFYKSNYSQTWKKHCKKLVAELTGNIKNYNKSVLEIGSNDNTLLKIFSRNKWKCIGVEPATNIVKNNNNKNIKIYNNFFTEKIAKKIFRKEGFVDCVVGTNVIAHIPDICDFFKGIESIFSSKTIGIFEFQYLLPMVKGGFYDTIYHEHFFYHSLTTLNIILDKYNLKIYNVKKLNIHSGSLRIYISKKNSIYKIKKDVTKLLNYEKKNGINKLETYQKFKEKVKKHQKKLTWLLKTKLKNKLVCAYGAAAKGNTLLNVLKIDKTHIQYLFDKSNLKNKLIFPGTKIPIVKITDIKKIKPNFIIILPWNIKNEIINELKFVKKWHAKFIVPFPKVKII